MSSKQSGDQVGSESSKRSSAVFGDIDVLTGEVLFSHLVDQLSRLLLWLGIAALLGSVSRAWQGAWHPVFNVQIAFMVIVVAVFFFRRRLKARYTAVALLTSLYAVSILGLVSFGPSGAGGAIVLTGVCVVSGAIYGRRIGLLVTGLVALSFVFVTAGSLFAWWPRIVDNMSWSASSLAAWVNIGVDIVVVSIGVILCVNAIQERLRQAVEMNRGENAFTQAVINAEQDLLLVFDPNTGKMIYWNQAFREFTGLSDLEIESRCLPDGWTDRLLMTPSALSAAIDRMLSGSKKFIEMDMVCVSGEKVAVEFRATVVDLPKHARVAVCIGRDLRERQALKESERHLNLITENIPVVVWAVNHGGQLIYMSPNVSAVCGFSAEELLKEGLKLWVPRIHADDQPGYRESFMKLLHSGEMSDYQYRFTTKDGRLIWLHERGVLTSGQAGEPAACGVFWDVTEQVKMADHLRQSEKLRALGELAGGVAHDFNNQIAAILGLADLLATDIPNDSNLKFYAEQIRNCACHAAELPEQLMTFARKNPGQCAPLDVHHVINQTVSILSRSLSKKIQINTRLEATNPLVTTNAGQLQNALLNLCLNARDALPRGGEIIVSTQNGLVNDKEAGEHVSLIPGEYLFLSVRDSGEGMSEATRARIFEPFFTTKPEGKGTGMGLAMVFGFVKTLGGEIEVVSEENRGTTMTLVLPKTPTINFRCRKAENKFVLLVDDDPKVLGMISTMLEDLGMSVVACLSGEQAIEEYRKREFSLVLLDIVMPEKSGRDVLTALREIKRDTTTPIVLISALASVEEITGILHQGASSFLSKPFNQNELRDKVCEVIA